MQNKIQLFTSLLRGRRGWFANHAPANPAGASRLQSLRPVCRVAELGSLGCLVALMQMEATNSSHYARAAVVFAVCMALVFVLPYLGVLLHNGFFFFATQFLFPYDGFVVREEFHSRAVFRHSVALALSIVQWTVVGVAYVWFARRLSVGRAIIAAIATIAVVGFITVAVFALFGVSLELDGP